MARPVYELVPNNFEPHLVSVGTSATAFPTPAGAVPQEIFVQAPTTNTVSVIVGNSTVLASMANGGFEFPAGSNFLLPMNNYLKLKCIASAPGQKLLVMYLWGSN